MKLHFHSESYNDVDLKEGRLTIGRDEANDVVLDHEDISGYHAEIHCEGGKVLLVDLGGRNGTWHGGERIQGRTELSGWDEISFASIKAELVDPDQRRPTKAMPSVTDSDVERAASSSTEPQDTSKTKARPAVGGWTLVGLSDDVKGKVEPIAGAVTIGRDEACELALPNELASRRHARLFLESGKLMVEDLGSTNGTWVNGAQTSGKTQVKNGDELRFDTTRFKASNADDTDINKTAARPAIGATAARPAAETSQAPTLRPDGGRPFKLKGVTTVGRLPDNDIVLDDDTVSGRHARIEPAGDGWKLKDLGSSNGTHVNGREIKSMPLRGGERLAFGEVELTFDSPSGSGTRYVKAVDDHSASSAEAGTRTSPRAASTKTSHRASSSSRNTPPWVWGVAGFLIVVLGFGAWMFRERLGFAPSQIDAPLQAGTTWQKQIGESGASGRVIATPVIADVNGDGYLGLVVADIGGYVVAFDGQEGKEIFSVAVPGRIVAGLNAADLTGDGASEIVVGTSSGQVIALNGRGQTVWESDPEAGLGEIPNRAVFAYVNEDDVPDVIVPTANRGLVALDGSRGWEIWATGEMTSGAVLSTPVVGDFNDDGATDFAYLTDEGQAVAISTSDSRVWRLWENNEIGRTDYASPALIRIDGRPLIVAATQAGVTALDASSGRMAWANRSGDNYIASPLGLMVSGKGSHDVALVSRAGVIRLLSGATGDEIWSLDLASEVSATPAGFDFTGDGIADLLVQTAAGQMIVIDSRRGRAVLQSDMSSAGAVTGSPLMGDLTRDKLIEVSMVDEQGNVRVLTMNRTIRQGGSVWPVLLGNDQHSIQW